MVIRCQCSGGYKCGVKTAFDDCGCYAVMAMGRSRAAAWPDHLVYDRGLQGIEGAAPHYSVEKNFIVFFPFVTWNHFTCSDEAE